MNRNLKNQSKHPVFTASSKIEVRMAMQLHTLTVSKVHPKVPSKAQMRLAGMDKQRPGRSIPWQAGNKIPSFSIGKKIRIYRIFKGNHFPFAALFFLPELSDPIWNGFILDQTNGTMPCIASELATRSFLYNGTLRLQHSTGWEYSWGLRDPLLLSQNLVFWCTKFIRIVF